MKIGYLFKEALRTISRNRGQFFLASAVMAICLLMTAVFLILTFNVLKLTESAAARAEIYAFVSDEIAEEPSQLLQRIANIAGITAVRFVSKAEAFEELRYDIGSDTLLLSILGENPIPASVRLTLHPDYASVENVTALEEKLLLLPGITEVWSGKELLAQLNQALKTLIIIDILILIIVAISVIFIAFQTIENSIAARAQEIEIMELIGASQLAVRTPFLLQGTAQGVLGSLFAFLLIYGINKVVSAFIPKPFFPVGLVFFVTLGLGVIFGLGGSIMALHRLPSTLSAQPGQFRVRSL
jgi:cell division transport system permease protein